MRLAAALNLLKWWLVAGMLAAFFGLAGVAIGGAIDAELCAHRQDQPFRRIISQAR